MRAHKQNGQQQQHQRKSVKFEIVYVNSFHLVFVVVPLKTPDSHVDRIEYARCVHTYRARTHTRSRREIENDTVKPSNWCANFLMVIVRLLTRVRREERAAKKKSQTNECAHK